jgi:hypothetical protein
MMAKMLTVAAEQFERHDPGERRRGRGGSPTSARPNLYGSITEALSEIDLRLQRDTVSNEKIR